MHLAAIILVLCATYSVALPGACQRRQAPTPPSTSEPHYLLFWRAPEQVPELLKQVGVAGTTDRMLGFGVPCATFVQEKDVPANIHLAFATARRYSVGVMLHFDFHVALQNRPDLWNWFDPGKPGYNIANKQNVEWYGWDGPPAKVRYLNDGEFQRNSPPICFTSKQIRQEWKRLVDRVIAPTLRQELTKLRKEGKERLFAGILVGSEPFFDNYSHPTPELAKMMAEDGVPAGRLGYRSLMDRGFSKDHPPTDMDAALAHIILQTVGYWCRLFANAGISADKLYPHLAPQMPQEHSGALVSSAFNRWSRPGFTTYPVGLFHDGFAPIYGELDKQHVTSWGGMEANAGIPGSEVDWESYLGWHYNHGAVVVAINVGATGRELPDVLAKSAFGPNALAAFRQFLNGGTLKESPAKTEKPEAALRRKMDMLEAGFRAWQSAGRDFSPIAHMVERRIKPLLEAGKVTEAAAVVDEAIKLVSQAPATPH